MICKFPEPTAQAKALSKIEQLKELATEKGWDIPEDIGCHTSVRFNLNSVRVAGTAQYKKWEQLFILRLHNKALEVYGDDFIETTVVHEFAHIIQFINYPKAKAHGREFKHIMRIFGSTGKRCHTYDLAGITGQVRKRAVRVAYKCGCRSHNITTIKQGKINRGARYFCRDCKETIVRA
jgi:SprT protein